MIERWRDGMMKRWCDGEKMEDRVKIWIEGTIKKWHNREMV